MEREILFRGKRVDNGELVYGYYVRNDNALWKHVIFCIEKLNFFEVIPETVGQFTGLTDKNGAKIFDGDIMYSESNGFGTVIWQNDLSSWAVFVSDNLIDDQYFYVLEFGEVIGNIHKTSNKQIKSK